MSGLSRTEAAKVRIYTELDHLADAVAADNVYQKCDDLSALQNRIKQIENTLSPSEKSLINGKIALVEQLIHIVLTSSLPEMSPQALPAPRANSHAQDIARRALPSSAPPTASAPSPRVDERPPAYNPHAVGAVANAQGEVRLPNHSIGVNLQKARQYDLSGNRPSACTFHALRAMAVIGTSFAKTAELIRSGAKDTLSAYQRQIIRSGLVSYEEAKEKKEDIVEGADLKHIQEAGEIPKELRMRKTEDMPDGSFENRLNNVVDALYSNQIKTDVVWIKSGNELSFAVIKQDDEVIIFDSHANKITLSPDKNSTKEALRAKLEADKNEIEGVDVTPFSYALGTFAR